MRKIITPCNNDAVIYKTQFKINISNDSSSIIYMEKYGNNNGVEVLVKLIVVVLHDTASP
jgi:hypothetical protein